MDECKPLPTISPVNSGEGTAYLPWREGRSEQTLQPTSDMPPG